VSSENPAITTRAPIHPSVDGRSSRTIAAIAVAATGSMTVIETAVAGARWRRPTP
jgi:hypothetical protein